MSDAKTIVVLGGGVGGVVAATALRKSLDAHHRVVIVDRERDHTFAPSFLWLMTGNRTANEISRPLSRLAKKGIDVLHGDVTLIDAATKRVQVTARSSNTVLLDADEDRPAADYIVISLGAAMNPGAIPGLEDGGHNLYSVSGAEGLRKALAEFGGGRIVVLTATPAYKCPAAPYEAAMLIDAHCKKRGIRDRTDIDLYAAEPGPLGVAGPNVSAGVRSLVDERGIRYHPEHQVVSVDAPANRISFSNGTTADFDLLAYVPPHVAPAVVQQSGLIDDSGWIPVDRGTLMTSYPGIFAIGDVANIPLKMGKPLPKAGVFAERQAQVVASNIVHDISGRGDLAHFNGHGECFIEVGDSKAGFGRGNFYAEPAPQIKLHAVGRRWHWGKLLVEKNWLLRKI